MAVGKVRYPVGIRRKLARKNKSSGHASYGYKGSYFKVSCPNPACDRRQSPDGSRSNDRSVSVGVQGIKRCPACGAKIDGRGYTT